MGGCPKDGSADPIPTLFFGQAVCFVEGGLQFANPRRGRTLKRDEHGARFFLHQEITRFVAF
jgi:hypothetical protein